MRINFAATGIVAIIALGCAGGAAPSGAAPGGMETSAAPATDGAAPGAMETPAAPAPAGPATSPEEVHERAKAAATRGRYADILPLFRPEDRDVAVYLMKTLADLMAEENNEAKTELAALCASSGLPGETPMITPDDMPAARATANEALAGVDTGALFAGLISFFDTYGDPDMSFTKSVDGELKGLKVDGDEAEGEVNGSSLHFIKSGEGWYLALK